MNESTAIDLNNCDREPIHIPGSIQPHGLLLVVDAESGKVVAGAGDIEGRLAADWLGRDIEDVIGRKIDASAGGGKTVSVIGEVAGACETFVAWARAAGSQIAVEMERQEAGTADPAAVLASLEDAQSGFERAGSLDELCRTAAGIFRQLTGYDRVMVYRFLDDDAGVVVAESARKGLASFMNHHFPATDIPRQARALYVRNRIRVIPDVSYEPAPLRPASSGLQELDMSDLALRSVSPIHIQYLRNMGVGASASISIVRDGVLWGLIACHNETPREIALPTRLACQALAAGLARQIRAKEEAELYRERLRLRSSEDAILAKLGRDAAPGALFDHAGDDLRLMLKADGFAAVSGQDVHLSGRGPSREQLRLLAEWVRERSLHRAYATTQLARHFSPAGQFADTASGLLAVTLPTETPTTLMWLRAEQVETINWAGNPHKGSAADPQAELTPRHSFEAWGETVRGRSHAWSLGECDAAERLMRTIHEELRNRRIRILNEELTGMLRENEALLEQKDFLLKEVNHRVQNSLQLVGTFLRMQARSSEEPSVVETLKEAERRLSAVALVHKRLYGGESLEVVDLGRYLDDLLDDMLSSMDEAWKGNISRDLGSVLVPADKAVRIGLVMTELIINANKYAYGGGIGPVSVILEQHRNRFRLVVADQGMGKSGKRIGFGSQLLGSMIRSLDGTIEEDDNRPGLRVAISGPLATEHR